MDSRKIPFIPIFRIPFVHLQWRNLRLRIVVSDRRASIGFSVSAEGIKVHLPRGLPRTTLHQALTHRYRWLQQKLADTHAAPKPPIRSLDVGSQWPLFGHPKTLRWVRTKEESKGKCLNNCGEGAVADGDILLAAGRNRISVRTKASKLRNFYSHQALVYAQQRVQHWQREMASDIVLVVRSVSVRRYTAKWGSCNHRQELKFNWLLAMAPKEVFDYVVVHEMCHLRHMHHGAAFWQLVEVYCPDFRVHKLWLKQNGHVLSFEIS